MGNIINLGAEEFAKKLKKIDVGEYFFFATDTEVCAEPLTEDLLVEWFKAQKVSLFDNEIAIVSKCGETGYEILPIEKDYFMDSVWDMFNALGWAEGVYTVDEKTQKQELCVSITPSFGLEIKNCAYFGENIFVPSSNVHKLTTEIEERNVETDLTGKIADLEESVNYLPEDLRRMAKEVIHRRDNCDGISERYWSIVDEVIRDFSPKKEQGVLIY